MTHRAPTLDDLNSLNHEIAALVKAGVPLELGLRGMADISSSGFSLLAERIANRLSSGLTLPEAVKEEGPIVSPIYAAVMQAGLSSGKLPEALESIASSGQIIQETRRRVWLAALYPTICAVVAYLIFCFFVVILAPRILMAVELFPHSWPINLLRSLNEHSQYFTTFIPTAVVGLLILVIWLRAGIARGLWEFLTSFRWIIGQSLNWSQFTELLALQVEQGVPLAEAFVQAADATEDVRWQQQALTVAQKLKSGKTLSDALETAYQLPPVVRWMLASGEKQGRLAQTLRQLTDLYRRQALRRAAIVKIWVPVTMTLVFTAGLGLTYGLAFVIPLRTLLFDLMQE